MPSSAARGGRTRDGQPIALQANLTSPADIRAAQEAGAEGVGLLRTEFLFAGAHEPPPVAVQQAAYAGVIRAFPDQPVTIRVLDPGAAKIPFLGPSEPAFGMRGARALKRHPRVLADQLAAIAGAAAETRGDVRVMAPMITDVDDTDWFVQEARLAGLTEPGVLIEVPSAALTAGNVLRVAGFASVGTNDLTQFTLAADRESTALATVHDHWHPAVLRLVELVGAAGSLAGKPVSVSGDAAADPQLACLLVGLGVTRLSMAPAAIAGVRIELSGHAFIDCLRYAEVALRAPTAAEARRRVVDAMQV